MVLVSYSDSEGSDTESAAVAASSAKRAVLNQSTTNDSTKFSVVDKSHPKKIRVKLNESIPQPTEREDGEPAAKRPRIGAGASAFSGFNALLPAPKRDGLPVNGNPAGNKAPARKVFSLKTGAEPAFSRDGDQELKDLFSGQHQDQDDGEIEGDSGIPSNIPKPSFITEEKEQNGPSTGTGTSTSKLFMFKPLSVARNNKKKKPNSQPAASTSTPSIATSQPASLQSSTSSPNSSHQTLSTSTPAPKKEKISLFSSGPSTLPPDTEDEPDPSNDINGDEDEILEVLDDDPTTSTSIHPSNQFQSHSSSRPETLESIATSLNLSAAERRQLLGRNGNTNPGSVTAGRVINFNTDVEYASNQAHIAAGEQIQHNPVRAINSGKHSLKSLVASAQGQKEALEESFTSGRRNKKEAGSKYGW